MAKATNKTNYWDYIRVENILSQQQGLAEDDSQLSNAEVRFIVIHQIDELWFKLVLRELESARNLFQEDYVPETALASACAALGRVGTIFKLAGDHFALMETMRTQEYLEFRDKLSPASGFQSAQMREAEILLGLQPEERISLGKESSYMQALEGDAGAASPALQRVQRRLQDTPSVKEAIYSWLYRTPINGSSPGDAGDDDIVAAFLQEFLNCKEQSINTLIDGTVEAQALTPEDVDRLRQQYSKEVAGARAYLMAEDTEDAAARSKVRRMRGAILFIESNRNLPLLSWPGEIIDGLIACEQAMIIFRQRHARMVERVIGRRVGTGGSAGVDYLDQTALNYRVFKEIWAARTMLLAPHQAPQTSKPEFYGLRASR